MPPPEKLKCKLLKLDADGDGQMDRGNTICLSTILQMVEALKIYV